MKLFLTSTILVTFMIFSFQLKPQDLTICFDNSSSNSVYNKTRLIEVVTGSAIHLWCHYCDANEDYYSKLWFYKPRGIVRETKTEIISGVVDNISITLSHTLNINNFNRNNSGVYSCTHYGENKIESTFTYVLEGVFCVEVMPKKGSLSQWRDYKRTYIDSINKELKRSTAEPFKQFRQMYNIVLNVYTIWDDWSECKKREGHQKGVRSRLARCRIRIGDAMKYSLDILIPYLTDGYIIPCRSIKFNETVPELGRIVMNIPEFEAEEICTIPPNTGNCKINHNKSKLTNTQVMENSHVILTCNDVTSNGSIKWFKDKKRLRSLYGNMFYTRDDVPHMSIDANNSLHILRITKKEEGNYTCSLKGKNVKQFEIKVVSKSKLLNQEFIRYSIYLGFVLCLTLTCYCAGVCVAWHRRASFLDPLNLHKNKYYGHENYEQAALVE